MCLRHDDRYLINGRKLYKFYGAKDMMKFRVNEDDIIRDGD